MATEPDPRIGAALAALRGADGWCQSARRAVDRLVDEMPQLSDAMIAAAAAAIVALWRKNAATPERIAAECGAVAQKAPAARIEQSFGLLETLRAQLEDALRQSRQIPHIAGLGDETLPRPSGAPLLEIADTLRAVRLHRPVLFALLPTCLCLRLARGQLAAQWRGPLHELLNDFRRRLHGWHRLTIAQLCSAFHAQAAPLITQLEARTLATGHDDLAAAEGDLRRLRQFGVATDGLV